MSPRPASLTILACLWAAGCGGGCSGSTSSDPTGEGMADTTQTESTGGAQTDEASEPVDPGPPPVLQVSGEPDEHSRRVAIRIENHGTDEAEIAGAVVLQRRSGEGFEDVEGVSLDLRFTCEDEPPECVTLAPGAVYLPPPWLGTIGDAQCACEECGPAPAGTYRFVVQSCNRAHTIEGDPFER